ncbi:MAG: cytochrome c [Burkholderiales bacterium]|nr:cytochrome c [Burkholderiales bacterium]
MKIQTLLAATLLSVAISSPAWAAGDAAAGKNKSTVCAACHGPDGNSTAPDFPKLAGQQGDYLSHTLKAYKTKARTNAIMNGQAATLSDQDIADLAAYYAGQKGLSVKR